MKRLAVLLALAACPAEAQSTRDPSTFVPTERVTALLRSMSDIDDVATYSDALFERLGAAVSFNAETLPRLLALRLARERASMMTHSLRMDLDWDGTVTRAEMQDSFAQTVEDPQAFTDGLFPSMDADGDGVITLSELRFFVAIEIPEPETAILADMLDWDLDRDGAVTQNEVDTTMRALFAQVAKVGQ